MLDFKTQTQLVDATAAMMRSAVTATANTWAASACKGLSLWAELLSGGHPRPGQQPQVASSSRGPTLWPSMADWMVAPQLYAWPAWPWLSGAAGMGLAWTPTARSWPGPSFSLWAPLGDWRAWGAPASAWTDGNVGRPQPAAPSPATLPRPVAPASFPASYRSAGGHAVAQVVVSPMEELVELGAKAVLSPMHTMLGAWRTALGA
jgi:hypothetical protein